MESIIRGSYFKKIHLCLLAAFLPVSLFILVFLTLLSSPNLGLEFKKGQNDTWVLAAIDKKMHGTELDGYIGQTVLNIAGREIQIDDLAKDLDDRKDKSTSHSLMDPLKYFHSHLKRGETVSIDLKGNGGVSRITVVPSGYDIWFYFKNSYILLILAFMTLALGLLVILKQPDDIRAVAFFILTLVFSTHEIGLSMYSARTLGFNYYVFNFIYYLSSIFGYASLFSVLYFSLVFPKPLPIALNKYFIALLILSPPFIVIISSIFVIYVYPTIPIISLLITIGAIIYNYFSITSPELKAQMRVILFGFVITTIAAIIMYFLPMLILNKTFMNIQGLMLLSFIVPLSMTFAITKYRLIDIDTLFDNTLIYSITIGFLVLLDIIVVYILSATGLPFFSFSNPVLLFIVVWIIVFAYVPLRDRISYSIKKIFKREIYDINQISLALSEEFISVNDESIIYSRITETITQALHPKKISACVYNSKGTLVTNDDTCCQDIFLLGNMPDRLFEPEFDNGIYPEGTLILPLITSTEKIGYIILHQKHSGRLYDSNDRKLLSMIANLAISAIDRIRYRDREMRYVMEKANMSREIHDSVGNTFVQAVLLSDMIRRSSAQTPVEEQAASLKKILSDGINDMRDLLWAVEQSEAKVGDIVYYISHKMESLSAQPGIKFNLSTSLDEEDRVITPSMKLNIIRIIQESITNIIKHAQATVVDLSITKKGPELIVFIKDNGKGFDIQASSHKENSYGMRNIKRRCEEMGAQLIIDSAPSEGTEITVTINLGNN